MYNEAYKKNPHDASLVSRIGQAYVKTHQYSKVRLAQAGRAGRAGPAGTGVGLWVGGEWLHLHPSSLLSGVPTGQLSTYLLLGPGWSPGPARGLTRSIKASEG